MGKTPTLLVRRCGAVAPEAFRRIFVALFAWKCFDFVRKKSNSHTVEMEETIKCKFNMNKNKDLGNEFVWSFEQEVPSPV